MLGDGGSQKEALRPDFNRSIVDLGFVKGIAIEDGRVSFSIELTTPACPVLAMFDNFIFRFLN